MDESMNKFVSTQVEIGKPNLVRVWKESCPTGQQPPIHFSMRLLLTNESGQFAGFLSSFILVT